MSAGPGRSSTSIARSIRVSSTSAPRYSAPRRTAAVKPESRNLLCPIAKLATPDSAARSKTVGIRCQVDGSSRSSQPVS